jgi:hypothetical protein
VLLLQFYVEFSVCIGLGIAIFTNRLSEKFRTKPHIFVFLGPLAMISAKSKTPKTISLSRRRLVKKKLIKNGIICGRFH